MDNSFGYEIPEFIREINNLPPDPKPTEDPGLDTFRIDVFYQTINNLKVLGEHDRYNFVKSNIDLICTHVVNQTCKYLKRLIEDEFLDTALQVLKGMPITQTRRLAVNKLCYSYQFAANKNYSTQYKLMELSKVVNREKVDALHGTGLNEEDSAYLCMARYSSSNENVNVSRLNYAIYTRKPKDMTEQQIVWIYEKLFDQMRYLFTVSMLETKDTVIPPVGADVEEFYDIFSTVSLALLTIVNNMTSSDIDRLIRIFVDSWTASGKPATRFSMKALSGDFGRVRSVVEKINDSSTIYDPYDVP